jgi:tRNA A-37 threonylcarbamoyl transferase component Bud32
MATLLDRVREALAPEYEVERELASGGMGVVFLGRDVSLDRRVAIKIIRPDLATATAAERFVREARVLASLSHPNIVPVHRAGESRGLFYYVMDYLEAETLADRLSQGPLAAGDAVAVAKDVLAALETAHQRGIVHRDVKPGNIFLLEGRAVLGDFGIAKATAASETTLTADGKVVGSPGYMAPEQSAGADVTPATDLYAVGLLLYEALTGENWPFLTEPAGADWSRVPRALVPALTRALAWSPRERWSSAAEFRRVLGSAGGTARPYRALRWVGAAVAVAAVGLVVSRAVQRSPPRASTVAIRILPFELQPRAMAARGAVRLGDSLAVALVQSLAGSPDFSVEFARAAAQRTEAELVLRGSGEVALDGTLSLTLRSDSARGATWLHAVARGPVAQWRSLAADSLASQVLLEVWNAKGGKLAADLPMKALPHTQLGLEAWIRAERLFARAQWEDAYDAYQQAIVTDSTCLLCRVRLTDVSRWLGRDQDSSRTARYRVALDSFPPHYQILIRASFAPRSVRWRLLDSATERADDFGLAWFIKGDEIFHRGPLDGYLRHDALAAMERATTLWPDFAPAWEHLAWIAIGEGDARNARRALDSLRRIGAGQDPFSAQVHVLLDVCYHWRFDPPGDAATYTGAILADPRVAQFPTLGTGARYLMTCDSPRGAVWSGGAFQRMGRPYLEAPGLLAEMYGYLALGMPDSAEAMGARLRSVTADPVVELFLAELPAALLVADSADAVEVKRLWPTTRRALERYIDAASGDRERRRRAAWLLALVGRRAGDAEAAHRYRTALDGEPGLRPFTTLVDADAEAARGHLESALARTEPLLALDSAGKAGDPFYRSFLHLMRAQWHASQGDTVSAVRDLRWHENNDLSLVNAPAPAPEAAEIDWSLGTLGQWRRARLLDRAAGDPEACASYDAVRRHWAGGEPRFAARAATADRRYAELRCGRGT